MTRAASLSPLVVKEVRALLPLWAATVLGLAAAFALQRRAYSDIALIGYVAGVVSLGAHGFGHEYTSRTLPTLLAQPVPRWRLFAVKLLIVVAMLATLAVAAAFVFTSDRFRGNDSARAIVLPLLAGVFTTPLFTMLCRNTLAGAVLGVSGPMTLWVIALLVGWWVFGLASDTVTAWFLNRWVLIAAMACPILAALTWRAFSRLEAVEGMPTTLTLPRWAVGRAGARRAAPWRALFAKELHLQQLTIAITLFYGVIWVLAVALRQSSSFAVVLPLEAVLLLYCLGLGIVIGALASAEERQQGTLDVQLLQPIGTLQQWAVKCVVTLGLALVLGVAMPAALIAMLSPSSGWSAMRQMFVSSLMLLVILLTSASLYISSLAASGVRAMTWSLPAGIAAAMFIQTSQTAVVEVSTLIGAPLPADHTEASIVASRVLPLLAVPVLLWFGFINHTSADHPWRRTLTQVGTIALVIVIGIVVAGTLIYRRS
jgi:ABC-type transport system involved in multi-copper enzyme maturation permease subunit